MKRLKALNGRRLAQRFDAGHDRDGNPRRFFLVYAPNGETIDAIDEGYRGSAALRSEYPDAIELGTVPTSAAFRRDMLREFRDKGAK